MGGYDENAGKTMRINAIIDTDGNGISDGDEDFDLDRLTNREELLYHTDIYKLDTDDDGLSDYEEINTYYTNPNLADSDNDGLNDNSEIRLQTNPLDEDTNGNGVKDGEELFTQEILKCKYQSLLLEENVALPSISITAKGDVNERISVNEYTGHLKGDELLKFQ